MKHLRPDAFPEDTLTPKTAGTMTAPTRRTALALSLIAPFMLLAACGGGSSPEPDGSPRESVNPDPPAVPTPEPTPGPSPEPTPEPVPAPVDPTWELPNLLTLVSGASTSLNLEDTLPSGVAKGGRFGVDPSGLPLPNGVSLTMQGILAVASQAGAGLTAGVLFTYTEP